MKDFLLLIKQQFKKVKKQFLFFIPIFLFALLLVSYYINNDIKNQISKEKILNLSFCTSAPSLYPVINSQNKLSGLDVSAQAYVIIDKDSKVILLSKNPNLRFSMASTVKIMTAITALSYFKINDILMVKTGKVEPAVLGLKKNDQFFFEDLLYAMLLPSANDAALAISQNYPGQELEFVKKMNENAKAFHLTDTHFSDSSGLDDSGNYTTAIDLARLSSLALENKKFAQIVSTKYKLIASIDRKKNYSLYNLNKLLGTDGVNGIKTGFTEEAGGVLVTSKIENGHNLILVVMKSQDRFFDTKQLLSLINGNLTFLKLSP